MATRSQEEGVNAFQTFSTLLALLLPILQFFFTLLPSSSKNIFIIGEILVPVSIIAGVFSYLFIIAFKNINWFNIPFNLKKHRAFTEFNNQVNYLKYETDEVQRDAHAKVLLKSPKPAPFYLSPTNVYYVLIPLLLLFVLTFLTVGIFGGGTSDRRLILLQAVSYIFSVSLTSLTLAVFYINETNRNNLQKLNRDKYQKIVQLLFDNNSLPEFPNLEFVALNDSDFNALQTYIKVNGKTVYQVTTDNNADVLKQVLEHNPAPGTPEQANDQS